MTRCARREAGLIRGALLTLWFLLLQSWKIGGYHRYLRDRVTATRGGGARCAVRSWRTCAITITCISPGSTPARSARRCTRAATPCSRTRVRSTRTRNSIARTRRDIWSVPRTSSCGSNIADRASVFLLFVLVSSREAISSSPKLARR